MLREQLQQFESHPGTQLAREIELSAASHEAWQAVEEDVRRTWRAFNDVTEVLLQLEADQPTASGRDCWAEVRTARHAIADVEHALGQANRIHVAYTNYVHRAQSAQARARTAGDPETAVLAHDLARRLSSNPLQSGHETELLRIEARVDQTGERLDQDPIGRTRVGAGVVYIKPAPEIEDPTQKVKTDPHIPESKRFCAQDSHPVGRSTGIRPGSETGECESCGASFDFAPKLQHGDVVAEQYEVAGALAYGGQGWVFLARDLHVDQWCVLKGRRNTGDLTAVDAERAELESLTHINHPGIVKIYNLVEHQYGDPAHGSETQRYIVMEHINGQDLAELRRQTDKGEMEVTHALAYIHAVLPALGYLHQHGFVYCDLKPENIMHNDDAVTLIDLGAAWRPQSSGRSVYGTAGYSAPELSATGRPTMAADLYSVGRTLAVLVLGEWNRWRVEHGPPPRDKYMVLREHDCLWRFLERACAPDPRQRFADTEDMAEAIHGVLCQVAAAEDHRPRPFSSGRWALPRTQLAPLDWQALPSPILPPQPLVASRLSGVGSSDPGATVRLAGSADELSWDDRTTLIRAHCALGDFDAAAEAVEKLDPSAGNVSLPPRTAAVVRTARTYLAGVVAMAQGRITEGVSHLRSAYVMAPGELACALALASALEASSDAAALQEARRLYRQAALTDPTWVGAVAGQARVLKALEKAAAFAMQATALALGTGVSYGAAFDASPDQVDKAAQILLQVPEAHPLRLEALNLACDYCIQSGRYDDRVAKEAGKRAGEVRPGRRTFTEAKLAATLYRLVHTAVINGAKVDEPIGGCEPAPDALAEAAAAAIRDQAAVTPDVVERNQLLDQAARTRPWGTWS